jgi:antitoxin HicB
MRKTKVAPLRYSWISQGVDGQRTADPTKRILAHQIQAAMKEKHFTKAEMARRMRTSRAALDRLLDPNHEAVTLSTLHKAAMALGCRLRLELV